MNPFVGKQGPRASRQDALPLHTLFLKRGDEHDEEAVWI